MKVTVRTVVATRVIVAVGSVTSIGARMIARIVCPRVIAVVVVVVPGVVVDVSVVVVNDGRRTATAAAAPVQSPGMPSPAKASTPTSATEPGANGDRSS